MIYVIINTSDVSSIDFSLIEEVSADSLRYNINGTKTFVKFKGSTPNFLSGKTQYSHSDILSILRNKDGEWYYAEEYES
tara:strand:- start:372 stop:608 length:237 start_codon:yes stop_codon:yes gene_type:complete